MATAYYLALATLRKNPDIKRIQIKLVAVLCLVAWIIPYVGLFGSFYIGTIGRANIRTTLGKIYFLIALVTALLSFYVFLSNFSSLLKMQYE
jgi:hypothetical protein